MLSKYTGTDGLYMQYKVHPASYKMLQDAAAMLGLEVDVQKLHVTVMYSNVALEPEQIENSLVRFVPASMEVRVAGITSWVGHNDDTYVVMCVQHEVLHDTHEALSNHGAQPTIAPFRPHITLGRKKLSEVEDGLAFQWNLGAYANRPVIKLYKPSVEDLKSD